MCPLITKLTMTNKYHKRMSKTQKPTAASLISPSLILTTLLLWITGMNDENETNNSKLRDDNHLMGDHDYRFADTVKVIKQTGVDPQDDTISRPTEVTTDQNIKTTGMDEPT